MKRLQIALTEKHSVWAAVLEQEKTPFQIVPAEDLSAAHFPVALAPSLRRRILKDRLIAYLASGGVAVLPENLLNEIPAARREQIIPVTLADSFYAGEARKVFSAGGAEVAETVAARPFSKIHEHLVAAIQKAFWRQGLPYARLSYYPEPYESAFSFRFDLDNFIERDFDEMCRLIEENPNATTCFVNLMSHERETAALARLSKLPTEIASHSYIHHVYDSLVQNEFNLKKAEDLLSAHAKKIEGFAGPHGRWTPSLQRVLETHQYLYSSEFGLDYDGLPFYADINGRPSSVLQIPAHPVCEGVFMERYPIPEALKKMDAYYDAVISEKIAKRMPIFIFGHPDSRIGRYPEIFRNIVKKVNAAGIKIWKTEFRHFAKWWKKRSLWNFEAMFSDGNITVQNFPLDKEASLELVFQSGVSRFIPLADQPYAVREMKTRPASAGQTFVREEEAPRTWLKVLKQNARAFLDWETKTPRRLYKIRTGRDAARYLLRCIHDVFKKESAAASFSY